MSQRYHESDRSASSAARRLGAAVRSSPVAPALGLARRLSRRLLLARPSSALAARSLAGHRGRGACVLYHRVHPASERGAQWGNAGLSVSVDDFELQIDWLARHCRCFALDEAVARLAADRLPPDSVVVTFDDGYRDNLELALPVLEKHGVPATVYVATGLIDAATDPWWIELERRLAVLDAVEIELSGRRRRWRLRSDAQRSVAFDQLAAHARSATPQELDRLMTQVREQGSTPAAANPMLSWDQVAVLGRHPLITLGGHTVSHPALRALAQEDAAREIQDSGKVLAQRSGTRVEHFAYPFGGRAQVGPREADLVAAAGYRSAVTTLEGHLHDGHAHHRFLLPRFPITRRDGLVGLRFKLSGWRALLQNRGQRLITI